MLGQPEKKPFLETGFLLTFTLNIDLAGQTLLQREEQEVVGESRKGEGVDFFSFKCPFLLGLP